MKTVIRIASAIDGNEAHSTYKLSALALKTLVESYSAQRTDEALLIVETGKDGKPVYLTLGSNPPEIVVGNRRVFAVFMPPESQEPLATFFSESDAASWAGAVTQDTHTDYVISEIDATDRPAVRVSVSVMICQGEAVLLCRLRANGQWTFPESALQVGESVESAAQRAAKVLGLDIGPVNIPALSPYVNVFLGQGAQHFLSLCTVTHFVGGTPTLQDEVFDQWDWFPASQPPEPLFATVRRMVSVLDHGSIRVLEQRLDTPPPPTTAKKTSRSRKR